MEVKKYGNRRLYDTGGSRYVTLEEVAERVRLGEDLRVTDAKTGLDLTQVTLAQLILESRGAARLLPVPLLKQLLRMRDDALAEFFGRYVTWALEVYLRLKEGARSVWNPFAGLGFGTPDLLARLMRGNHHGHDGPHDGNHSIHGDDLHAPPPPFPDEPPAPSNTQDELAELRREMDELKRAMKAAPKPRAAPKPAAKPRAKPQPKPRAR
nr:polyhydroxyalkanoate synthesis regulator DNA-binding domain-containing protein [Nannocystis sp.]